MNSRNAAAAAMGSAEASHTRVYDEKALSEDKGMNENEADNQKRIEVFVNLLRQNGDTRLRNVRARLEGDTLYLEGEIHSFYAKQIAQELVRPHANGLRVCNNLQVHVS